MELVLGAFVMALVPAYFVAQPLALARWRGGWRRAAFAPLLLTVPAGIFSAIALAQDSNLWPLMLIFAAGLGSLYLCVLWGLQRVLY